MGMTILKAFETWLKVGVDVDSLCVQRPWRSRPPSRWSTSRDDVGQIGRCRHPRPRRHRLYNNNNNKKTSFEIYIEYYYKNMGKYGSLTQLNQNPLYYIFSRFQFFLLSFLESICL